MNITCSSLWCNLNRRHKVSLCCVFSLCVMALGGKCCLRSLNWPGLGWVVLEIKQAELVYECACLSVCFHAIFVSDDGIQSLSFPPVFIFSSVSLSHTHTVTMHTNTRCLLVKPHFSFLRQWCDSLRLQVCFQLWEFPDTNYRVYTVIFIGTKFSLCLFSDTPSISVCCYLTF